MTIRTIDQLKAASIVALTESQVEHDRTLGDLLNMRCEFDELRSRDDKMELRQNAIEAHAV